MSEATPETTNFGLTRLGRGEQLSKNGYAFTDSDVTKVDALLLAALTHVHDGAARLGNPSDPPTGVVSTTGGQLPANTTFYYKVAYVDQWKLETSASPEVAVTTAALIAAPTAPALTVEGTGGTAVPGVYGYQLTFVDSAGGETTVSATSNVQILSGTTNRIKVDLPSLASGAVSYNIYRTRPGQSGFYYIANATTTPFYDTGAAEDQTMRAPVLNTTHGQNSITITVPLGFIPVGTHSWTLYRATASGAYDGASLVHNVTEGATDTDNTPRTTWVDTGAALATGFPRVQTATVPGGSVLTLSQINGQLQLNAMARGSSTISSFLPGVITNATVYNITSSLVDIQPVKLTAYFITPPTTGTVRLRVTDAAGTPHHIELSTAAPIGGDPTGYYRLEYPLIIAGSFEAEVSDPDLDRSSNTVPVVSDLAASSGQAITLSTQNQWVQVHLGELEVGSFTTFVTQRVLAYATSSTNDFQIQAIRADTSVVLATTTYTLPTIAYPTSTAYVEVAGPTFTAPGGVDILLRVQKTTTTAQSYNIDKARFAGAVPTLVAGQLTIEAFVDSGPTDAANANIVMWF